MKKGGILNPALCQLLARTGHTDYFTICDRGFPVPDGPERIDLALVDDIPTVLEVLTAIAGEYHIDRVVVTQEMQEISPGRVEDLKTIVGIEKLEAITHVALKRLSQSGKATVRTGDTCPYANIIVVSG
ncbi:MAG: D-ribose pyranase [Thermomicrobiales bacterium]